MEVLQQVLRYSTHNTSGAAQAQAQFTSSKDDLAWLGLALEAVGREESEKLAVHQKTLLEFSSHKEEDVLCSLDYMEDFVETYDSALGWIQAGGADIVLHLLGSANAKLFSRTCRFLSTLLQNHIPVQKAVFVSPLGAVLFQCLAQARDTSGDFLSDTFKTHTSDLSATTTQVESPSEMPAAAGASAEHVSWRQANSAAATTTALSADDAAAATSTVLSQWGSLSIDQIDELTCLLSAVSCLTRAADSVESFFVRSSGVQVLAGILCSARPSDAKHLKLCRRTCVFLKALLMASTLRARVAQELLEAPRLLEALGGILTACLEGQQVTEIDLLENALFILQHLAVHAAVSGSERSARPVAPEALTQALVSLRDCLPTDSQSHRQIAAIQKALATAFPQS